MVYDAWLSEVFNLSKKDNKMPERTDLLLSFKYYNL